MISPIFPEIANLKSFECRVYMASSPTNPHGISGATFQGIVGPGLRTRIDPLDVTDFGPAIKDVATAENTVLSIPTIVNHDVEWVGKDVYDQWDAAKQIFIQASSYAARLAMCNRRGPGNVFLMGSDIFDRLSTALAARPNNIFDLVENETVGRWTKKGQFLAAEAVPIYVCDEFAAHDIAVLYVGKGSTIDGPGGLITDSNGDLHLRVLPPIATAMGSADDFIRRFHVNFK